MKKLLVNYLPFYIGQQVLMKKQNIGYSKIGIMEGLDFTWESPVRIRHDAEFLTARKPEEINLLLRPWHTLTPAEVGSLSWDNDSMYWVKQKKNGKRVLIYEDQAPTTLRPNEYMELCRLGIDLFDLIKDGLALDKTVIIF